MSQNGQMQRKLAEALQAGPAEPMDQAAVQLARRYAQLLDEARDGPDETLVYDKLGPKYLAVLTALGLTPAGRGAKPKETPDVVPGADELAALRAERAGQR